MANPTDSLPTFAVQGLPATMNPIPQVQPNLPSLAPQQPAVARPVVPPAGFVPRGPTPYGVPGQAMPAPAAAAVNPGNNPVITPAVQAAAAVPAAATQSPAAQTAATPDNSPVIKPPIPPQGIDANGVPLPGGPAPAAGAGSATAPAQQIVPAFPLLNPAALNSVYHAGPGGGSQISPDGIEVDRGGVVSRYGQNGALVSGPGNAEEAAYNRLIAANPNGGIGQLGTAYAQAIPASPGVNAAGMPAAPGGLRDPSQAISAGFDRQQAYAQNFLDQGLAYINGGDSIWERATRGRAIAGILHAVAGQNNEGSVQGQGADSLNTANAMETDAGTMAGAQRYSSDLNRQNITDEDANRLAIGKIDAQARSVTLGQNQQYDPTTGINKTVTTTGQPIVGPDNSVTIKPNAAATPPATSRLVEGATSIDKATGKKIIVRNGQWTAQ